MNDIAPTPNLPLLWATLEEIQSHPENWNQGLWRTNADDGVLPEGNTCGTAYCFAGTAAVLAGHVVNANGFVRYGLGRTHVSLVAEAELGLDALTADELFDGTNDLDDIQRVVKEITERAS